jgi:ubiquinone/menaquinone biosynthesis C-methylase UbiE
MAVKQRIVRRMVGQFHRPHGLGGYVAGWVMSHRSSNVRRNRWVVSLLDVQPTDRVLEIGFGPGIAVKEMSRRASDGTVLGVDHSDVMVRIAQRRNASAIRAGRVELYRAGVDSLPDLGSPVDKILAVNSCGFWPDPQARLEELQQVLRPGGTIALVSQPRCPGATRATSDNAGRELVSLLSSAGFSPGRVQTLDLDPPAVCVCATWP